MSERPSTCLLCRWCYFTPYQMGYSDETPSDPLKFECLKGHWDIDTCFSTMSLAKMLGMVRDCPDFELDPAAEEIEP